MFEIAFENRTTESGVARETLCNKASMHIWHCCIERWGRFQMWVAQDPGLSLWSSDTKHPQIRWPNRQFSVFCMIHLGQKAWNRGVNRLYTSKFGCVPPPSGAKLPNFLTEGHFSMIWYHTFRPQRPQIQWSTSDLPRLDPQNLVVPVPELHRHKPGS
jgi:hypothetical protein